MASNAPTATQTTFSGSTVFIQFNSPTGALAQQGDGENTTNPPTSLFSVTVNGVQEAIESLTIQGSQLVLVLQNALPSSATNVQVSYSAPPTATTGVLEAAGTLANVASFSQSASYAAAPPVSITIGNSGIPIDFTSGSDPTSIIMGSATPVSVTLNSDSNGTATITVYNGITNNPYYQSTASSGFASEKYIQAYATTTASLSSAQLSDLLSIFPNGVNSSASATALDNLSSLATALTTSIVYGVNGSSNGTTLDNHNYSLYSIASSAGITLQNNVNLPASGGLWGAESVSGSTSGNETFFAGLANTSITGGSGNNTVEFLNASSDYSIQSNAQGSTVVTQTESGVTNSLTNIQNLAFGDTTIETGWLAGAIHLNTSNPSEFKEFTELYLAYFNRAPDAIGLDYWANNFFTGATESQIAINFSLAPEFTSTYGAINSQSSVTQIDSFINAVYSNVLNRQADASGLAYWQNNFQTGASNAAEFILQIVAAVNTQNGTADAIYLAGKEQVGYHFAVTDGLTNTTQAAAVMTLFNSNYASSGVTAAVTAANALSDSYLNNASTTPELVVHLVGVAAG
jgi:Domain of unknown function (DUF4214)/Putative flagellar system-associated repeat